MFEDVPLPKPAESKGHTSIWKDYKFDPVSNAAAIAHDTFYWKVHRFVKDPKELGACIEMVKEYFEPIKEIHTHLAAKSTFPSMDKISYEAFCKDIRILGKHVNAPALDRVFIVVNVEIE